MNRPERTRPPALDRGQRLFIAALLTVGVGFLGLAAYRAWGPLAAPRDIAQEARDYLRSRKPTPLSVPLEKILADTSHRPMPTQAHPLLGQPAPPFALPDHRQQVWKLEDLLAQGPVVVVFYYGYHCNHCVSQLFDLNEDLRYFRELGAEVVAISADPPELTAERFRQYGVFGFPVLADEGNRVAQRYDLYRPGRDGREGVLLHGTFVVDRSGTIVWANSGDLPFEDNRTLLKELARLGRPGSASPSASR